MTGQASMLFDLSYASRDGLTDNLRIFGSKDCGLTYDELSFNFPTIDTFDGEWFPQDENDWRTAVAVNLNAFAGEEDVRIAFVVRNQNGNNLFIDNIEFFVTADPSPVEMEGMFSVYGYDLSLPGQSELKIAFNLPERQTVRYSVINVTGQMETDGIITDVLNQTYPLDLPSRLAAGVYFVRVQIGDRFYTTRVLVL